MIPALLRTTLRTLDPSNSAPAVVVKLIRGENEKKEKETQ
jgi:hypothetical protein